MAADIQYKINDLSTLDEAITISLEIFNPSAKEIKEYHDKKDWEQKIKKGLLIMVYVEKNPAGFVLCYIKEIKSLHIQIGGILEKYRGLGLWNGIYEKIEKYAKDKNFERLTLNTYKDKFPVMYKFANTHDFLCYKTEIHDNFEKSYFEKNFRRSE